MLEAVRLEREREKKEPFKRFYFEKDFDCVELLFDLVKESPLTEKEIADMFDCPDFYEFLDDIEDVGDRLSFDARDISLSKRVGSSTESKQEDIQFMRNVFLLLTGYRVVEYRRHYKIRLMKESIKECVSAIKEKSCADSIVDLKQIAFLEENHEAIHAIEELGDAGACNVPCCKLNKIASKIKSVKCCFDEYYPSEEEEKREE